MLSSMLVAATDHWADEFFGLGPDQRFVLILTVIGCATGIVIALTALVLSLINATHRRRIEAELKREMLDRGMSAEEVVKVIESAAPPEDATGRWIASWCKQKMKM
jgi:hypothetical protein